MKFFHRSAIIMAVLLFSVLPSLAQSTKSPQAKAKPTKQQVIAWIIDFIREKAVPYPTAKAVAETRVTNGNLLYTLSAEDGSGSAVVPMSELCSVRLIDIVDVPPSIQVKLKSVIILEMTTTEDRQIVSFNLDNIKIALATTQDRERLLNAISDLCDYNCAKASGLY